MGMFAIGFTLICCLLFLVPTYLIVHMVLNPVVAYWVPGPIGVCAVIPFIILIAHLIHIRIGAPNKWAIGVALVVPALILFAFSNITMAAGGLGGALFSIDCNAMPEKADLERAWQRADTLFTNCLSNTAKQRNESVAFLEANFHVQDCTEYDKEWKMKKNTEKWNYLRYLEETQQCGGWCKPNRKLWSKNPGKDSCAVAISALFANQVAAHSEQVQTIMGLALAATGVMFLTVGPVLRDNGFDW